MVDNWSARNWQARQLAHHHEAAHAVVAVSLGLPLHTVEVERYGMGKGMVRCDSADADATRVVLVSGALGVCLARSRGVPVPVPTLSNVREDMVIWRDSLPRRDRTFAQELEVLDADLAAAAAILAPHWRALISLVERLELDGVANGRHVGNSMEYHRGRPVEWTNGQVAAACAVAGEILAVAVLAAREAVGLGIDPSPSPRRQPSRPVAPPAEIGALSKIVAHYKR